MSEFRPTLAQEIAEVARASQQRTTGHEAKAVTVVLSQDTLVVTLHDALSPAQKDLAKSASGAAQVQEFHRKLFSTSSEWLRKEFERITGVEWPQAAAEVEPATGAMVQVFTRSEVVQLFHLGQNLTGEGSGTGRESGDS